MQPNHNFVVYFWILWWLVNSLTKLHNCFFEFYLKEVTQLICTIFSRTEGLICRRTTKVTKLPLITGVIRNHQSIPQSFILFL